MRKWGNKFQKCGHCVDFSLPAHPVACVSASLLSKPNSNCSVLKANAPMPGLVDQFFNDSTGMGPQAASKDASSIVKYAGLQLVESPMIKGKGLDITPVKPVPNSEEMSPVDSTPVGATKEKSSRDKKRAS
jgi:hypothetical protein